MRVYKFLTKDHAMQALRRRRLKVARFSELNDPFDMLPIDLSDRVQRIAAQSTLEEMGGSAGMLCFSRAWTNPVVWAHYADQHRGICLGFDVLDAAVTAISYARIRRPFPNFASFDDARQLEMMKEMLHTKFEDWRYEDEVRASIKISIETEEGGLLFVNWNDDLHLAEVIVGMRSSTCKRELERALDGYAHTVQFIRAQASLTSFAVEPSADAVRNHDDARYFVVRGNTLHPVEFYRDA